MVDFKTVANIRVKAYLRHNSTVRNKKAIKAFFATLKNEDISKARMVALIKGSKDICYLIEGLCADYCRAYPYSNNFHE